LASLADIKSTVLITNGGPAALIALAPWIREYGSTLNRVYITTRLPGAKNNVAGLWKILRTSGLDYTNFKIWTNLILPAKLRRMKVPATIPEYLSAHGYPCKVTKTTNVNSAKIKRELANLHPDFLLSHSASQKFSEGLLATPSLGGANMHFSPLPQYAGLSPYFWQLYCSEPQYTISLHRLASSLDTGEIISTRSRPMHLFHSVLDVFNQMSIDAGTLWVDLFKNPNQLICAQKQNLDNRSYYGHPSYNQVTELKKRNIKMLSTESKRNFLRSAKQIISPE